MTIPDGVESRDLPQSDVAPQRSAGFHPLAAGIRGRGPHPLPVFLETIARICGDDRARLARVLAGLRRYQQAGPGAVRAPRPAVGETAGGAAGASLRDYADRGASGPVVVVVPSLINAPTVLDLAPGNSLLDGLAARGLRPLMVDWGTTGPAGLEELTETRLVPLIAQIGAPVAVLGYCLGGTLALAAAAMLGTQVSRIALLATPWHFSGYGHEGGGLIDWWEKTAPLATALGAVPMDLLQPAFWSLDPEGLAAKYERLADLPEAAVAAFAVLEDWSNTGEPLSLAAARGLAEDLFRDDVTGRGEWQVGGRVVDPGPLGIPILDIIASRDRIVPPGAALSRAGVGEAMPIDAGHVGMVVGGRAPALLWDPLAAWLRG